MTEPTFFLVLLISGIVLAVGVLIVLFFINAPYGRHQRAGWGPLISGVLGWLLMEAPAAVLFALYYLWGSAPNSVTLFVFLIMWEAHYIHRGFIYPFDRSRDHKRMPLLIALMGLAFNTGNTYLNGRYLFSFSGGYPDSWLSDPRFVLGVIIFCAGYLINRWADRVLRQLRRPGETGYRIPYGGLYRWISCPNYFGEILEWTGWALATWSLPGLVFAIWTFANLAPRAAAHHAWYHQNFPAYPPERRALIPRVW